MENIGIVAMLVFGLIIWAAWSDRKPWTIIILSPIMIIITAIHEWHDLTTNFEFGTFLGVILSPIIFAGIWALLWGVILQGLCFGRNYNRFEKICRREY